MIQLTAAALKLDLASAVKHLIDHVPGMKEASPTRHEIDGYIETIRRQKNVHNFLTANIANFSSSNILMPLKIRLGIGTIVKDEWGRRGGQFMISATREQIDNFISHEKQSVFHGWGRQCRDWKEVLVIPFYDLPGRISALQFCYVQGEQATPFHYRSVIPCANQNIDKQAGIAMFDAIEHYDRSMGNDLFVFTDPVAALRLQLVKLRDSLNQPTPLVAVHNDAKPAAYLRAHCPGRRLIFWSQHLNVSFFRHVKAANGWIADHRPTEDQYHFMRRYTPTQLLTHLRNRARRWEAVLEDYLAVMPILDLTAFMMRLDWTDDELDQFIDGCAPATRTRLAELRAKQQRHRRVIVNNHGIAETDRGWQLTKTDEVISEMVFQIDKVIHYDDGRHFYQGKTRYKETSLNFTAPAKSFDAAPWKWLRKFFIHNNAGAPSFLSNWQSMAMAISHKFQSPITVPGLDACGWHERRSSFMTADYAIKLGGEFVRHELPMPDDLYKVTLPAPDEFGLPDIELFSQSNYSTELGWAAIGCVLHDVLARVFRYATSGLMVSGDGADNMMRLVKSTGCPTWHVDNAHGGWPENDVVYTAEKKACWPILMPIALTNTIYPRLWARSGQHNSIINVDWSSAHTHMICNKWKYIDVQQLLLDDEVIQAIGRVVSAFLLALSARSLQFWHKTNVGTLRHMFANLAGWFKEAGGDAAPINHAYNLVRFDEEGLSANMFFELLVYLYNEGRITSYRSDCVPKRNHSPAILYLSERQGAVWIPKPELNRALHGRQRQMPLDLNAVSVALADNDMLLDERDIDGVPGWVVPKEAWEVAFKLNNKVKTQRFGVVR